MVENIDGKIVVENIDGKIMVENMNENNVFVKNLELMCSSKI